MAAGTAKYDDIVAATKTGLLAEERHRLRHQPGQRQLQRRRGRASGSRTARSPSRSRA
ncbi:MAG: hypothetical protein M0C28_47145 [Candidatus Moduliflexus flocculans]|nr:hypothetical protein [Candidatus Moduliflexus flocculans]